jgi:uncharacterized membrane protein (UPF0182 family)
VAPRPQTPASSPLGGPLPAARWIRVLCGAFAALLLAAAAVIWTTTDYLWFRKLGFAEVFRVSYGVRWAMFGVAGGFVALVTGFSAGLARALRPPLPDMLVPSGLARARAAVDQSWSQLLGGTLVLVGGLAGLIGARSWATWVQFANRTSFGRRDPQFHLDISFFVFVYPFLRLVLAFLFAAVLLALAAAAVVHVLYGGLRFRPGDTQVTPAARAQLFGLLGFFVLFKAAAYWLDRYGIEFSSHDVISGGASYTTVHAVLPAKTVLAVIAALCAGLFFVAAARHDPLLPAVGLGLLVLSAVLLGGVYPATVEQLSVKPHELTRETTYLGRQLAGTRQAFGLTRVQISTYPTGTGPAPPASVPAAPKRTHDPVLTSLQSGIQHSAGFQLPARLRHHAHFWPGRHKYLGTPLDRVAKLAPFLTLDGNVYPVVVGGELDWVVDGYTTTDRYPASAHFDTTAATAGGPAPEGPGRGAVDYIRDSVKAVVQADSGRVTLYQWDTTDPILRTWMKALPGLIEPRRDMPRVLRAHLRYPVDLFDLQRQVLASYHVATAAAFYYGRRAWTVVGGKPVSLNLLLPGQRAQESSRTAVYTRTGGTALAAYLTVASDPSRPGYGTLRLMEMPPSTVVAGPSRIQTVFRHDPVAIAAVAHLRHRGITVIPGPLVSLPAGHGFLYAEPVYVARAGRTPTLGTVLLSYGGRVAAGRSTRAALAALTRSRPG